MADTIEELESALEEAEQELRLIEPHRDEYPDAWQQASDHREEAYRALTDALLNDTHEMRIAHDPFWCFDEGDEEEEPPPQRQDDRRRHVSGSGGTIVVRPAEPPPGAGTEWSPALGRPPAAGDTLQGFPIVRNSSGGAAVQVGTRRYNIRSMGSFWGLHYGGRGGPRGTLEQAIRSAAELYRADGQLYKAAGAEAYRVVAGHEGGLSAINTYDDKIFTLGGGFTGGRLGRFLENLAGTPGGDALSRLPYFTNLQFNGSPDIRLDVRTIDQVVQIVESPAGAVDFARAQVREFVRGSACGDHTNFDTANELTLNPLFRWEILGIAAYLRHGRPAFAPDPAEDLRLAITLGGPNLSLQVAVLLKLHAQRLHDARTQNPGLYRKNVGPALERRMPNKFRRFVAVMGESSPGFSYDYGSATSVIPCIRPPQRHVPMWTPSTTQPAGIYLQARSHFFDFGARIEGALPLVTRGSSRPRARSKTPGRHPVP